MSNGVSYTSTKPIEEFEINKKNKPSDLISRLSELRSQYSCFEETERDAYHTLSEAIEALQVQKTGKWINANEGKWNTVEVLKCSVCGEMDNRMYRTDKYCPNCGTRMEREEDD